MRWVATLVLMLACDEGPYVIGEQGAPRSSFCPEGVSCEGRFELPLDRAGTSAFGDRFVAEGIDRAAALLLRGEDATETRWPSRTGGALDAVGPNVVALEGPFTDATRGAIGAYTSASVRPRFGGRLAIELVLRATPSTEVFATDDLRLALDAEGALVLERGGEARATEALAPLAWHHVLFVLDGEHTRVFVDGAPTELDALTLPEERERAVSVGGDAAIAWLAVVPLGSAALSDDAARERFVRLVGVAPTIAGGAPLPIALERESVAFTDLVDAAGRRRLHLVGPRWPRIACRLDVDGARFCGYLAERGRTRAVPLSLDAWSPEAVTREAPTEPRERTLAPALPITLVRATAANARLVTTVSGTEHRVASVFARGEGLELSLRVAERTARFALDGRVVSADPEVEAHAEDFGDGWWRVWLLVRDVGAGTHEVAIELHATGALEAARVELAGPEVESNRFDPTSVVLDTRAEDRLVFAAAGNVPAGTEGALHARALVPGVARLHDQALLNLNVGESSEDQINLYLDVGGTVSFSAHEAAESRWNLASPSPVRDGRPVEVDATWGAEGARLSVRGEEAVRATDATLAAQRHDRLAIGRTGSTSGPLDGLIAEVAVGTP